jgi:hypothetical protein
LKSAHKVSKRLRILDNSNELEDTITMLKKMVSAIEKEIIDLKGKI